MTTRRLRTGCRTDWLGSVWVEIGWRAGIQVLWQWRTRGWSLAWVWLSCGMEMSNCRMELLLGRRDMLGCGMGELEKIVDRLGCRMEL